MVSADIAGTLSRKSGLRPRTLTFSNAMTQPRTDSSISSTQMLRTLLFFYGLCRDIVCSRHRLYNIDGLGVMEFWILGVSFIVITLFSLMRLLTSIDLMLPSLTSHLVFLLFHLFAPLDYSCRMTFVSTNSVSLLPPKKYLAV